MTIPQYMGMKLRYYIYIYIVYTIQYIKFTTSDSSELAKIFFHHKYEKPN